MRYLEHGEKGAGECAEVVGVALGKEVEGADGEDREEDAHDREGVDHWGAVRASEEVRERERARGGKGGS